MNVLCGSTPTMTFESARRLTWWTWLFSSAGSPRHLVGWADKTVTGSLCDHFLRQLGFRIGQIVVAGGDSLAKAYGHLAHDLLDPFPDFKQVLDDAFPAAKSISIGGTNPDNPFPLRSPRRLSMRLAIATFSGLDVFTTGQVLSLTGNRPCVRRLTVDALHLWYSRAEA